MSLSALALLLLTPAAPDSEEVLFHGCFDSSDDERASSLFLGREPCGTDSSFHPVNVVLNNGLDILRQPTYPSRPSEVDWGTGFRNVVDNLAHPSRSIRASGGLGSFVAHEVFPYRGIEGGHVQFVPNLTLHLIGEGMLYRMLWEWYELHDFPAPALWSLGTSLAALLMNEAAENNAYMGPNWDPIADIYVFNALGYLLFSFDGIAELFRGPVVLDYWPGQGMLTLNDGGRLLNHGENYAVKISLGEWTSLRAFGHMSNHALFGVSIPVHGEHEISLGAGIGLIGLEVSDNGEGRVVTHDGKRNFEFGVFWDHRESLLASVGAGGFENPFVKLNVYPGFLRFADAALGIYAFAGRFEGASIGFTIAPFGLVPGFASRGDESLRTF